MKEVFWHSIKIVFFTFLILVLQIAVLKEITDLSINLPLIAVISIASFSNLSTSLYSTGLLVIAISLLSYNNHVYWDYLLLAFVVNQFNPKNLSDKFLVAAFYCIVFSPIFELIYAPSQEAFLDKCISVTLINLATLIPVYFVLKLGLSIKKRELYT